VVDSAFRSSPNNLCIAPEVPRTHHISGEGALTINRGLQLTKFDNLRISSGNYTEYKLDDDDQIRNWIMQGQFITCFDEIISNRNKTLLVYVGATSNGDQLNWRKFTDRFNMWGVGLGNCLRGVYKGTVSLHYNSNFVIAVAVYSPFVRELPDKFKNAVAIQNLQMCNYKIATPKEIWPPTIGEVGASCDNACRSLGFECDINYFPVLTENIISNFTNVIEIGSFGSCDGTSISHLSFPFYDLTMTSVTVTRCANLYNCHINMATVRRICPCLRHA